MIGIKVKSTLSLEDNALYNLQLAVEKESRKSPLNVKFKLIDEKQTRSQLSKIITNFNHNPPKIALQLDISKTEQNLRTQLAILAKKSFSLNIDPIDENGKLESYQKKYKSLSNTVKKLSIESLPDYSYSNGQIELAKNKLIEISALVKSIDASGGITDPADIARVDELSTKLKEYNAYMKSAQSTQSSYFNKINTTFTSLYNRINKSNKKYDRLKSESADIKGLIDSLNIPAGGKLVIDPNNVAVANNVIKRVEKLKSELKNIDVERSNAGSGNKIDKIIANVKTEVLQMQSLIDGNKHPDIVKGLESFYERLSSGVFDNNLSGATAELEQFRLRIEETGAASLTFGERMKKAFNDKLDFGILASLVLSVRRLLPEVYNRVKSINTSMIELRKVTDVPENTLSDYFDRATKSAKDLHASISTVITATANFSRLGFSLPDAEQLGGYAVKFFNVGDDVESIDDATSVIVSSMAAFNISADEAMTIIDKLNEIGNNFSISSGGAAEALKRSASSLYTAGNDINQALGLIVAGNAVVQNPDSVGTTLKTLALRIRGASVELEEAGLDTDGMATSVSNLRDEIKALTAVNGKSGVDIMLDDSTFKSTYQILKEISGVFDDLTDVNRASLLEMIAGKRNANVASSILTNFEMAENAVNKATNSAGSANKEYSKWMDSIDAKTEKFSATFDEFSLHVMDSDFVKGAVDAGSGLLGVLNALTSFSGAPVVGGAIGALMSLQGTGFITRSKGDFVFLSKTFSQIKTDFEEATTLAEKFKAIFKQTASIKLQPLNESYFKSYMQSFSEALSQSSGKDDVNLQSFIKHSDESISGYLKKVNTKYHDVLQKNADEAKQFLGDLQEGYKEYTNYIQEANSKIGAGASNFLKNIGGSLMNMAVTIAITFMIEQAIKLVSWIQSEFFPTLDQMNQRVEESVTKVRKISQDIEEVNTKIDETNTQIKDLTDRIASGNFTIFDKQELEGLKAYNRELAFQKEYLERSKETASEVLLNDIENAFNKSKDWLGDGENSYSALLNAIGNGWTRAFGAQTSDLDYSVYKFQATLSSVNALNIACNDYQNSLKRIEEYEDILSKDPKAHIGNHSKSVSDELEIAKLQSEGSKKFLNEYIEMYNGYLSSLQESGMQESDIYHEIFESRNKLLSVIDPDAVTQVNFNAILSSSGNENYINAFFSSIQNSADAVDELKAKMSDDEHIRSFVEGLVSAGVIADTSDDSLKALVNTFESFASGASSAEIGVLSVEKAISGLRTDTDNILSSFSSLSNALEDQSESGYLSADSILSLVDAGYAAALSFDAQTGAATINRDMLIALAKAKIQNQIADLQMQQSSLRSQLIEEGIAARFAANGQIELAVARETAANSSTYQNYSNITAQIAALNEAMNSLEVSVQNVGIAAKNTGKSLSQIYSEDFSNINDLLDMTIKMLKQEYEDRRDALQEERDAISDRYSEESDRIDEILEKKKEQADEDKKALEAQKKAFDTVIDKQKELLKLKEDEYKYQKELDEKVAAKSKIESELAALSFDDSDYALKRRAELMDQLKEASDELEEYQHDHSIDMQEDALDKMKDEYDQSIEDQIDRIEEEYDAFEKAQNERLKLIEKEKDAMLAALDKQIKAIEDYISKEINLRNEAIALIEGKTSAFYSRLIEYNRIYGDGIDATVRIAWNNAYESLNKYNSGMYNVISTLNLLKVNMDKYAESTNNAYNNAVKLKKVYNDLEALESKGVNSTDSYENKIKQEIASYQRALAEAKKQGAGLLVYQDIEKRIKDLQNILKSLQSSGGGKQNTIKLFASGTKNAPKGLANVDELGREIIVRNGRLTYLETGDGVVPHNLTERLFKLAQNPASLLSSSLLNATIPKIPTTVSGGTVVNQGDIIINGNADQSVVNKIKEIQKDTVNLVLAKMNAARRNKGYSV